MEDKLIYLPQMLLIGSSGRNSGKTTLAASLIRHWKDKFPITALKITTIEEKDGKCPRGGRGCGVCTNIKENFELIEEKTSDSNKDTSLLLAAGAERVYWLKVLKTHIKEGIEYFLTEIPENNLIICESNSLRNIVRPGVFIMLKNTQNSNIKKSASEVMDKADFIVEGDFRDNIDKVTEEINHYFPPEHIEN
ncbi:hypothetical protein [Clostridium pasteurianum]|uniref:Molybdopterin-guanine dinucleotide biosynthesis protein n=1 Tax=Clostridium pasteurianum BC1 TaxID=86416 RepID=R4K470_CLOPA|nr:hypothetical protein [Clostridium pasteurianum]AGK95339.1 hypothetical protein Clopa_0275 [Clostridium pasteurianum BC1]